MNLITLSNEVKRELQIEFVMQSVSYGIVSSEVCIYNDDRLCDDIRVYMNMDNDKWLHSVPTLGHFTFNEST